jgi:hypothetical protein
LDDGKLDDGKLDDGDLDGGSNDVGDGVADLCAGSDIIDAGDNTIISELGVGTFDNSPSDVANLLGGDGDVVGMHVEAGVNKCKECLGYIKDNKNLKRCVRRLKQRIKDMRTKNKQNQVSKFVCM